MLPRTSVLGFTITPLTGLTSSRTVRWRGPPSPKTMGVPHPLRFGQRVGEKMAHLSGGFHRQLHARPVVDPPTQRKPRWVGHPVFFMRYTLASKEWATRQVVTIANSIQETAMTTLPRAWPNSR